MKLRARATMQLIDSEMLKTFYIYYVPVYKHLLQLLSLADSSILSLFYAHVRN